MRDIVITIAAIFAAIAITGAFVRFSAQTRLDIDKSIEPQRAALDRKVFEESSSFIQGKNRTINKLHEEYILAKPEDKSSLKKVVLSEAQSVDNTKLDPEVQSFLMGLKGQK